MNQNKKPATDCVFCHKCQDNCVFLSKYGIDIGDVDRLRELAYHCFLCGRCSEVCPVGIDGRAVILEMRQDAAQSAKAGALEKSYKGLLSEKRNYKFRNYKHAKPGTVFFPGCNLPSLYPKTVKKLVSMFREVGIETVYDCCGKPIAELGFKADDDRIISDLNDRFKANGITEIVVACPNCRDFFGDRLDVKITGVYEKLHELGMGNAIDRDIIVFVPCPDRERRIWIEEMKLFARGEIKFVQGVQCCGLGGSAIKYESELAAGFTQKLSDELAGETLTCYCASCAGRIRRNGYSNVSHILTEVLGINENPDTGKSYINRMLTRIK